MYMIDYFSRKVWVIVMKTKDEAFEKFNIWLAEVENQTGKKVKYLKNDNGLEYLSNEFNLFCQTKGIIMHKTVPGTPHQNGVAERFNRTLLERIKCMIISFGLTKSFWGEAATTTCYPST